MPVAAVKRGEGPAQAPSREAFRDNRVLRDVRGVVEGDEVEPERLAEDREDEQRQGRECPTAASSRTRGGARAGWRVACPVAPVPAGRRYPYHDAR